MTQAMSVRQNLRERVFHANVEALTIGTKSKQALLDARPRGKVTQLADGNPVIEVDGRIIGAPADVGSRAASLADVEANHEGVTVVFGLGMGHAVRELRERTSAKLVVFEPDPGLLRMVLESGPSDLGGIPIVCQTGDLESIWSELARDHATAVMVRTPGYDAAYPEAAASLGEAIRRLVADVSLFANTRAYRFRSWLEDIFANLDVLCETTPFTALAEHYAGVPAFIVGAGPSLQKNIALLGDAARRGIVFAVDVAGKVFAKHDLEPQVLVCLEALNLSDHLRHLPFIDRVVRAFSLTASPHSLTTGKGPLLPFFEVLRAFSPLSSLTGVQPVSVGGSVSTVAFSIAEQLGCSPIVLVGQDLAYTGGRTHAEGTPFEGSRTHVDRASGTIVYEYCKELLDVRKGSALGPPQALEALFEVPAWGGEGIVNSTSAFNGFRKWFEGMAEAIADGKPDTKLINASEGGSRIAGYEERTLADVLRDLPLRDISGASIASAAREARAPLAPSAVRVWAEEQAGLAREAQACAKRLAEKVAAARKAVKNGDPQRVSTAFRELTRAEEALRAACFAQPFLDGWAYAQVHGLVNDDRDAHPQGDTQAEAAWGLEKEERLAEVLTEAANELAGALGEIGKRMTAKLARSSHEK